MKIRIKDCAVRYRITLKELDELNSTGRLEAVTEIYSEDGAAHEGSFRYGVAIDKEASASRCAIEPGSIMFHLCADDAERLNAAGQEGVYLRRESRLPGGRIHRFMAFVEKDRPGSTCDKPEAWIYEEKAGAAPDTRQIGEAAK